MSLLRSAPFAPVRIGVTISILCLVSAACAPRAPDNSRRIRVTGGDSSNFADLPTLVAQRRLEQQGYQIETIGFAQAELAAEALARGTADIAFGSMTTYWAAAMRGAPVVTVMEQCRTRHILVARRPIRSCADLQGRTVAVNSLGATGGNLLKAYLAEECPGTEPAVLVMPRPANRSAALLTGGIDAAMVLREDAIRLMGQSEDLVVIEDLAVRWPDIATVGMHVNVGFARDHPEIVDDIVRASLLAIRDLAFDPVLLADAAQRELGEGDGAMAVAEAFVKAKAWDPSGGITPATVSSTIRFLLDTRSLAGPIDAARVVDRSFLDRVQAELAQQ